MAQRIFDLSGEQRGELRQAYDAAKDTRYQQRLQAVRLYGEGWAVKYIQEIVGCSERSLLRGNEHYRENGVTGLQSGWSGGNNARPTVEQRCGGRLAHPFWKYKPVFSSSIITSISTDEKSSRHRQATLSYKNGLRNLSHFLF